MSHKFPTKKQYCMKQEFRVNNIFFFKERNKHPHNKRRFEVNRKNLLRKGKELTSHNKRGFEGKTTRKLVYL